jgi:hypothetical protein
MKGRSGGSQFEVSLGKILVNPISSMKLGLVVPACDLNYMGGIGRIVI